MGELGFGAFAFLLVLARIATAVGGFGPGRVAHDAQRRRAAGGH